MNEAEAKAETPARQPSTAVPVPAIPDHELLRRIGRGAYGEVWLARSATGAYRAVKIVSRRSFDHDRPFEREFSGILKFEPISRGHESQLDILHVGREEGYFYYVMELGDDQFTGQHINPDSYAPKTLKSESWRRGRVPFDECVQIGLALTTALEHLHSSGLVHRDVKPSNIIFVSGVPKLADIGLVTGVDATRSYVGTEGFAPPEGPGTPQGDLYSLGKVLYEICTGNDRQNFPELPTNVAELPDREGLVELNAVIAKACREDPRERYQSAVEMHSDLVLLQAGKSLARLRVMQRRLGKLKRVSLIGAAVAGVCMAAFLWQSRQTHELKRLADENLEQVVRFQMENFERAVQFFRYSDALHWLAQALPNVQRNPSRESAHRVLLGSVLANYPKLNHLFVPEGGVAYADLSPDGRQMAVAAHSGKVDIYDLSSEAIVLTLPGTNQLTSIRFSSDGQRLIGTARQNDREAFFVWGTADGKDFSPSDKDSHGNRVLAISRDGRRYFACVGATALVLRDIEAPGNAEKPINTKVEVKSARFSDDGQRLLLRTTGDEIQVWDVSLAEPVGPAFKGELPLVSWAASADGNRIVTRHETDLTEDGEVLVWDAATGKLLYPALKYPGVGGLVSISPDGRWVLCAGSVVMQAWDLFTGRPVALRSPDKRFGHAVFSPDSVLLAGNTASAVKSWNLATDEFAAPPLPHPGQPGGLAFAEDGHHLLTWDDRVARVWDLAVGQWPKMVFGRGLTGARFSPDGRRIATFGEECQTWDAFTGAPVSPPFARGVSSEGGSFDRDGGRVLTAGNRFLSATSLVAQAWFAATGQPASPPLPHRGKIQSAEFSPDGTRIVTASKDLTAKIWDATKGTLVVPPLQHDGAVNQACFSPDGRWVVTASEDGSARVWDAQTGTMTLGPMRHKTPVRFAGFSPDGRRIATTSGDRTVRVWDANAGTLLTSLFQGGGLSGAAFSPDSRLILAWGNSSRVSVWEVQGGQRWGPTLPHYPPPRPSGGNAVYDAQFSADGRYIVTTSENNTARVWDAQTCAAVTMPLEHPGRIMSVSFSPNGQQILTTTLNESARVWQLTQCNDPGEDVTRFAQVLSAYRIERWDDSLPIEPEELLRLFNTLRSKYPDRFECSPDEVAGWHEMMAQFSGRSARWQAAVWHLDRLFELKEPRKDWLWERGFAHAELGQWAAAAADIQQYQLKVPNSPDPLFFQVHFCLAQGDFEGYRAACRDLVNGAAASHADPEFVAWCCVLMPDSVPDFSQVLTLAKQADDPTIYGGVLYRAGKMESAIQQLEHGCAQHARGGHLTPFSLLAMAHARLGHQAEAQRFLEKMHRRIKEESHGEDDLSLNNWMREKEDQSVNNWMARLHRRLLCGEAETVVAQAAARGNK